jgi:phosphatidylglycerophosphate synthase
VSATDNRDVALRRQWSQSHGGAAPDSSRWVSGYLALVHAVARPLARRRVSPDAVTLAGLALAALVPLVALPGAGWPLVATAVLVLSSLLDGLDGAVARLSGAESDWGRVLDPLADRLSELCFLAALWVVGAPGWLCALVGGLGLLHESVRATARAAGMSEVGAITVGERPWRVIVAAFTLGAVALLWCADQLLETSYAGRAGAVATGGAAVGAVLAVVGLVHLLVVVHQALARRR